MAATRTETDSLGPVEVPADALFGAQTARSLRFFAIGEERMPLAVVRALVRVKRAAAEVNARLGLLDAERAAAIVAAADEVLAGGHDDAFPLSVWQTGSGTQTNMNVNEVLANLANRRLGRPLGAKAPVHPNDHVNLGQSSNDAFPTAMHLAIVEAIEEGVRPPLRALRDTLAAKATRWADLVKVGRTHLQDATPLTLGQEISGWVAQLDAADAALGATLRPLLELAIGGTAVGTGLNAHPRFGEGVAARLASESGRPFVVAANRFAALAAHDALVTAHGALSQLATAATKIANDVRWLASGPRSGLGELRIPENEPGSSIMPGKTNPTQAEALTMVAARVLGNHTTIAFAASQGAFELNVYKPVLAHTFLQSARLLGDALASFDAHCAQGIEADEARITALVERSLMLVTALVPRIGYDAAARVARHAHATGSTLAEAAEALGVLSAAEVRALVVPSAMVGPGEGT